MLETDSVFWFWQLHRFPKLYRLFLLLPRIKKARAEFLHIHELRNKKLNAVKLQKYHLAATLREQEQMLLNKFRLSIQNTMDYRLVKNKKKLGIILFSNNDSSR